MSTEGRINWNKVFSLNSMGDSKEDSALLAVMAVEAKEYMIKHRWCTNVLELYWGLGVGKCFAVFLSKILPAISGVDEYLWVIVGDIPSLYIVTDNASTPAQALYEYIKIMEQWANAAIKQERNAELLLPPVAAPFTIEHGRMLSVRLNFMKGYLKKYYKEDLSEEDDADE